jgi:hypothetical protein
MGTWKRRGNRGEWIDTGEWRIYRGRRGSWRLGGRWGILTEQGVVRAKEAKKFSARDRVGSQGWNVESQGVVDARMNVEERGNNVEFVEVAWKQGGIVEVTWNVGTWNLQGDNNLGAVERGRVVRGSGYRNPRDNKR